MADTAPQPQPEYNPSFVNASDTDHGRTVRDILTVIESSRISSRARELSAAIFQRMARAEARVHGVSVNEVHFHEVGGIDAIVDIVGFAIAYDLMGISGSSVSAVPLGRGHIKSAHGLLPIPAPAVLNIVAEAGLPSHSLDLNYECLTPTGAAILCEVARFETGVPVFSRIHRVGYGAGTKNPSSIPNVCRVIVGETVMQCATQKRFNSEEIAVLETNVDDMTPQAISAFIDLCLEKGALDASVVPCLMKKSRPGHLISILCTPELRHQLSELVLVHTTSLGVRSYVAQRMLTQRRLDFVMLDGEWKVAVKVGSDLVGNIVNVQPEFDDCVAYARHVGIPVKEAHQQAVSAYMLTATQTKQTPQG